MPKHKYRCGTSDCRRVYNLARNIHDYAKEKRCACGGTLHSYHQDRARNKTRTCHCDGVPYPHKKGSSVWCVESKLQPTEQDYINRYGGCTG